MSTNNLKPARSGPVSSATLRTEDLLSSFISELEWQINRNGDFLSLPENRSVRDWLNNTVGDAQDCFGEDGESIEEGKEEDASESVNELIDALNHFAPAYCYFGAHPGDGADFGFWPDFDAIEDTDALRVSDLSEVPSGYCGEVIYVNDHGNTSIYATDADGTLRELVSFV